MLDKQAKNEYTEKGKGAAGRRLAPHKLMEVTACLQGLAVTSFYCEKSGQPDSQLQ
ncbi:MAG: hypothetical protein HFJ86_04685 [Oscillospiraceae bacterium]|nr:hypothetical protein [Oscillospiraceae bacterium]